MKCNGHHPTKSSSPGGINRPGLVLVALLCAGVVFGCAQIRKATYPQDYVYLEQDELRNRMVLLSIYMRQLNETQLEESDVRGDKQQRVLDLLNKVKGLTTEFGGGVTTNHLVIDEHIDQFKIDISNAIRDASANPPNYYAVGRLTGSCVGCHKYRS